MNVSTGIARTALPALPAFTADAQTKAQSNTNRLAALRLLGQFNDLGRLICRGRCEPCWLA
ncbi:hypothetical protein G3N59_04220 [Paraburkholderia sp. Ac-20340]|uniref:hypothetical protein n=1 Tax=Paraburkholderia sp. Ac-20340 TaxID=2703888 RepID=UPI00197F99B0|nr:hypothetical protein [Paraburkholderia sp. Ac-20340]MBN3852581.1 hypothetical protein [Paraburkholderia sp. Ac-20340]